ncbi:unnamed protein product, partial [Amoebophrya sp. A25]|eukprot:GSA25T00024665001.1
MEIAKKILEVDPYGMMLDLMCSRGMWKMILRTFSSLWNERRFMMLPHLVYRGIVHTILAFAATARKDLFLRSESINAFPSAHTAFRFLATKYDWSGWLKRFLDPAQVKISLILAPLVAVINYFLSGRGLADMERQGIPDGRGSAAD